jgi:hypothetical protein
MLCRPLWFRKLSSAHLSKSAKIKIQKPIMLSLVFFGCETWPLAQRKEYRLRVFENRMLRTVFGPETGGYRKLKQNVTEEIAAVPVKIIGNLHSRVQQCIQKDGSHLSVMIFKK